MRHVVSSRVFEAICLEDNAKTLQGWSAAIGTFEARHSTSHVAVATEVDFSIVVCTYNRSRLLERCLQSLVAQDYPAQRSEIIVIDNNSTDETRRMVTCFPFVRYFLEREQGLSAARNRGWREARGRFVAFVDDESIVPVDWLRNAARIVRDIGPDIFGGPYCAWYPDAKPAWFKDSYQCGVLLGDTARPILLQEYLSGTNIFVRRELFGVVGGFDPGLGMKGKSIRYGEEPEFQNAVRRNNPQATFYYDPALTVRHGVRSKKMKLRWVARDNFIRGRYAHLGHPSPPQWPANAEEARTDIRALFKSLSRLLGGLCIGSLRRDRQRFQFYQNYVYEEVLIHMLDAGFRYERVLRWMTPNRAR